MGLAILLLLVGVTLGTMRLLGLRGPALTMAGAALMLGAAGYALQGRPGLAGSAAEGAAATPPIPLDKARAAFFGRFYSTEHWLILSDSMARRGNTLDAVKIIQSGLRDHPRDYTLWVGLGNALTDHAQGLNPAAEFAFARARAIAPTSGAPDYFLGLAKLRSGDLAAARTIWSELLARSPAEAEWRPTVEDGVRLIDGLEARRTAPPQSAG